MVEVQHDCSGHTPKNSLRHLALQMLCHYPIIFTHPIILLAWKHLPVMPVHTATAYCCFRPLRRKCHILYELVRYNPLTFTRSICAYFFCSRLLDPADSILQMLDCSYELIYEFILFRCTQIRHQTNRRLLPCNWGSWCTRPWRRLVPPVDSDLPSDTWRPGYRSRCWVWES